MANKITFIFQMTTAPVDLTAAIPHTGGWSETLWTTVVNPLAFAIPQLAAARALLLPAQAKIVGYRIQNYTIVGNKLLPGGATSGRLNYPGNPSYTTDLPQCALFLGLTATNGVNGSRQVLRCIPDAFLVAGEYQPTSVYKTQLTLYGNLLTNGTWYWVGRDTTQPSAQLVSLAGGVATFNAPIAGVAQGDYLRFHRVYDINGNPVKGSYRVMLIVGNAYTLQNPPSQTVQTPSGTMRKDLLVLYNVATMIASRAVVRKIGRPSQGYRGRRSHLRV